MNIRSIIFLNILLFSVVSQGYANNDNQKFVIGFLSSWQCKCGIATYTEHLYHTLKKKNYEVFVYDHKLKSPELIEKVAKDRVNVLNIQFENGLYPDLRDLFSAMRKLKKMNVKIVVTAHVETDKLVKMEHLVDQFIFHKPSLFFKENHKKLNLIPFAVAAFQPQMDRSQMRKKYGFLEDDIILTTFGFLSPWKEYSDILDRLAGILKSNPHYRVQMLTSYNEFGRKVNDVECEKIRTVIKKYKLYNQVIHVTKFLSQAEISERLWLSDLGYLWGDVTSFSTSGASKEFITARLPLVVTDCSHFHDIHTGAFRIKPDKALFIQTIQELLKNRALIEPKRQELESLYKVLNYDVLINEHIRVFDKALRSVNTPTNFWFPNG